MGVAANFTLLIGGDFVPGPLGDVISNVETFITVFTILYGIVLFAYILMSWVRLPYSLTFIRIQRFAHDVSEPYLRLFRRILPMAGPIDLSPMVAFLALGAMRVLAIWILGHFHH